MINFAIYSSYHNGGIGGRLLKQVIEELRHSAVIVSDLDGAKEHASKSQPDIFIARFSHKRYKEAAKICDYFENKGVLCSVSSKGILNSFDKSKSNEIFLFNNILTPQTHLIVQGSNYKPQIFPVILKPVDENKGKNIFLAKNIHEYNLHSDVLIELYGRFIVQKYIEEAKNKDTRAFVVGDKVVAAMERRATEGSFIANLAAGGEARAINLSNQEADLAVKASQCFQAEFSGVDLIQSATGPMVLEVNCSPGFKINDITGIDTAKLAVEHLIRKKLKND